MPDSIIALKSRSGEIFRRMVVLHRELRDANFYVVNLSDKQKQRNSIIATEIQALSEENNAILNEIDFYKKNGFDFLSESDVGQKTRTMWFDLISYK